MTRVKYSIRALLVFVLVKSSADVRVVDEMEESVPFSKIQYVTIAGTQGYAKGIMKVSSFWM